VKGALKAKDKVVESFGNGSIGLVRLELGTANTVKKGKRNAGRKTNHVRSTVELAMWCMAIVRQECKHIVFEYSH
jgi:hypothetical protein